MWHVFLLREMPIQFLPGNAIEVSDDDPDCPNSVVGED